MDNFQATDVDYFSVGEDIDGYNFVEGKVKEYRHTFINKDLTAFELNTNKGKGTIKGEWTELRAHEYSRKLGVDIIKTQNRTRKV